MTGITMAERAIPAAMLLGFIWWAIRRLRRAVATRLDEAYAAITSAEC